MEDVRCKCGKIICQTEAERVVIKCRHCKRFIIISTKGLDRKDDGKVQIQDK